MILQQRSFQQHQFKYLQIFGTYYWNKLAQLIQVRDNCNPWSKDTYCRIASYYVNAFDTLVSLAFHNMHFSDQQRFALRQKVTTLFLLQTYWLRGAIPPRIKNRIRIITESDFYNEN